MKEATHREYDEVVSRCKKVFIDKLKDYGPSWLIFRLPSLTDQILIKAKRIRRLEELKGRSLIPENVDVEYIGILNYCVMALIKLWHAEQISSGDPFALTDLEIEHSVFESLYGQVVARTKELMEKKNHDYGEAWRDMRIASITDQILVKIHRIKAIEDNDGRTLVSEQIDSQYSDILNYCVFALIKQN